MLTENSSIAEPKLEIPLHNFFNQSKENQDYFFLGRKNELEKLINLLKKDQGGSYLVSGYRGVGKTRFVTEAIRRYKEIDRQNCDIVEIKINLGSDNKLSSKTVLTNIVSLFRDSLEEKYSEKLREKCLEKPKFKNFLLWLSKNKLIRKLNYHLLLVSAFFFFMVFCLSSWIGELSLVQLISLGSLLTSIPLILFFRFIDKKEICIEYLLVPLRRLEKLQKEIILNLESNLSIGNTSLGYFGEKEMRTPLDNNQIESKLKKILRGIQESNNQIDQNKLRVLFVFDELDKLSGRNPENVDTDIDLIRESKLRKMQIDSILGDLKSLITDTSATYIFIAGRDMYDAYLSERGSTNSLYESLFHDHIYIPSLLTDRSNGNIYQLDSMIEAFVIANVRKKSSGTQCLNDVLNQLTLKENASSLAGVEKYHGIKILIHFLALHSWGNYKRLITLFESFVKYRSSEGYILDLSTIDLQRLVLASHLYIMFHHNLSRMLMNADDKLVVSSFSVFLHVMKYHGIGFTKENILRMYETINVHSSPELARVVEIILKEVLSNHIRIIRDGVHHYRFSYLHEKEIHFITNINDDESAAFNFSLNAMDAVKQHYRNLITDSKYAHADDKYGHVALASIHIIVGNFHFWEQSYDEANIQYGIAADILEKNYLVQQQNAESLGKNTLILQLIEVYLRQGSVAESLGNYAKAESIYNDAELKASEYLHNARNKNEEMESRWGILLQPKWAKNYLQLKRDQFNYTFDTKLTTNTAKYKEGILLLFSGKYSQAYSRFMQICCSLSPHDGSAYFLFGNAYFRAAFSLFLNFSTKLQERINGIDGTKEQWISLLRSVKEAMEGIQLVNDDFRAEKDQKNTTQTEKGHENTKLKDFEKDVISKNRGDHQDLPESELEEIYLAFGLLRLSVYYFNKGRFNLNSATSSLSIVMMWQALLEAPPWQRIKQTINDDPKFKSDLAKLSNGKDFLETIEDCIHKIKDESGKNIILTAQEQAFSAIAYNTKNAFSHFMKTGLHHDLGASLSQTIFEKSRTITAMILDPVYLTSHGLYQQYSIFGQVVVASIYWERMAFNRLQGECIQDLGKLKEEYILPYGIRYYSTLLWLRGRAVA